MRNLLMTTLPCSCAHTGDGILRSLKADIEATEKEQEGALASPTPKKRAWVGRRAPARRAPARRQ